MVVVRDAPPDDRREDGKIRRVDDEESPTSAGVRV